jgi:hypothetical protein
VAANEDLLEDINNHIWLYYVTDALI